MLIKIFGWSYYPGSMVRIKRYLRKVWVRRFMMMLIVIGAGSSSSVSAGTFGQELGRCLLLSATPSENILMVRWVFSVMGAHPSVAPMTRIQDQSIRHLDQQMADMFFDMVLVRCSTEAERAVRFEGETSFEIAFQKLGEYAMQQLMEHPAVTKRMEGFLSNLD